MTKKSTYKRRKRGVKIYVQKSKERVPEECFVPLNHWSLLIVEEATATIRRKRNKKQQKKVGERKKLKIPTKRI